MKFYEQKDYICRCESKFTAYKVKISKILPNSRVEHIGASSIVDAISKGDLDIYVGVDSNHEEAINSLKQLGFHEKEGTLRTDELCMLESDEEDDVAIQVVANGSQFECFLDFRDKLNESKELVEQYNKMKRQCEGMEHNEYRKIKSEFIENVLYRYRSKMRSQCQPKSGITLRRLTLLRKLSNDGYKNLV